MGGFAGGGLADFEDPGVLLNNGTMYGHGSMGYDPEKPRRTPSSSCIGTLAVGGGGPQADDLIPDPPVAPDTYFYTTNTAFSAISPGGNLGLYYECVDNGPGNKTEWTLIESGSGGLQLLDASGQTGIAAINDSADFVGNDSGGVFLTENTPPVPGAPPNPNLGTKNYFLGAAGAIPAGLQPKIRNIRPLMMSNRAVPTGTDVQPLFSVLFTADTLRTETPSPTWQNTTFILRIFTDGSTGVQEAAVPQGAFLQSINANGIIAAIGDPNGGGLWHALLLAPDPLTVTTQAAGTVSPPGTASPNYTLFGFKQLGIETMSAQAASVLGITGGGIWRDIQSTDIITFSDRSTLTCRSGFLADTGSYQQPLTSDGQWKCYLD